MATLRTAAGRTLRPLTSHAFFTTNSSGSKRALSSHRQHSIVSSFICTPATPGQGHKFALFKRSSEKAIYPNKWAICSGSMEPTDTSPEAAAKREIYEETGLGDEDLKLVRRGEPYRLVDDGLETEWVVHPFAWELKEGARSIRLDREHSEVRFIRPEELGDYDHVEKLEVGVERVFGKR